MPPFVDRLLHYMLSAQMYVRFWPVNQESSTRQAAFTLGIPESVRILSKLTEVGHQGSFRWRSHDLQWTLLNQWVPLAFPSKHNRKGDSHSSPHMFSGGFVGCTSYLRHWMQGIWELAMLLGVFQGQHFEINQRPLQVPQVNFPEVNY